MPTAPAFVATSPFCPCSAFDLVNIHLFHDASNLVAWETSPSVYSGIRHKALGYVLDRWVLSVRPSLPASSRARGHCLSAALPPLFSPICQNTKLANVDPNPAPRPKA